MVTVAILPHEGPEEKSKHFASNSTEYQAYLDYLESKYSNKDVEYAYITEGSEEVNQLVFDRMPSETRRFTNFEQFINVARKKRF